MIIHGSLVDQQLKKCLNTAVVFSVVSLTTHIANGRAGVGERGKRLEILDERVGVGDVVDVSNGSVWLFGESRRATTRLDAHKYDYDHENGDYEHDQAHRHQYVQL